MAKDLRLGRIEICGGIASGKTTLVTALQEAGVAVRLEDYRANPFWQEFCEKPSELAFETELSFLLQHYWQMRALGAAEAAHDTSLIQDRAYADVNLHGEELEIFDRLYRYVVDQLGRPKLVVWLKCPADELFRRIAARNRDEEQSLKLEYLERLNEAITVRSLEFGRNANVLAIDSSSLNFANDSSDRRRAVQLVLEAVGRE